MLTYYLPFFSDEVLIGVKEDLKKRGVGGADMPGFQTKVLMVTSISDDNFRLISLYCMVS